MPVYKTDFWIGSFFAYMKDALSKPRYYRHRQQDMCHSDRFGLRLEQAYLLQVRRVVFPVCANVPQAHVFLASKSFIRSADGRNCQRNSAVYYLSRALQESKQQNKQALSWKKCTVCLILAQVNLEVCNIVFVTISKKPNFHAKFIEFHWHVLLEGKPHIKFHKTLHQL